MVRDSRTPGTYTLSVFTKAIVRYGANSLISMGRDSPEGGKEGGTHSNVRQSKRSRGHWNGVFSLSPLRMSRPER